ncbi:hypothetical protein Tco_0547099, partial [Tanacetum coccineum]
LSMAEFLRLPDFRSCKITDGDLLPLGAVRVTHLVGTTARFEDLPPKTRDMFTAEIPYRKVLDDKERKRKKAQENVAANAP